MPEEIRQTMADPETIKAWRAIKQKYPEAIVLLRIEDNCITFSNDATITYEVTAIERWPCDQEEWQCNFNHCQTDIVLHKLVKAGYQVAICDRL